MKYLLSIFALCILACSPEPTCIDFAAVEWCSDTSTSFQIKKNTLVIENQKDGLFFAADVTFEKMLPSFIVNKQEALRLEYSAYTRKHFIKKGIPFESYSESNDDNKQLKLNNTELVSGEIYGFADLGIYTIKYKGINEDKVERIIAMLME